MMQISSFKPALRAALQAPDQTLVGQHRDFIEAVRREHPHDICFVCLPRLSTCGMYAFGLTGKDRYNTIAYDYDIYAGPDFFYWLLEARQEPLQ